MHINEKKTSGELTYPTKRESRKIIDSKEPAMSVPRRVLKGINWIISPGRGENKRYLKPPTGIIPKPELRTFWGGFLLPSDYHLKYLKVNQPAETGRFPIFPDIYPLPLNKFSKFVSRLGAFFF